MTGQRQYYQGMDKLHYFIHLTKVHIFIALNPCHRKHFYVRNTYKPVGIAFMSNSFKSLQNINFKRGYRIRHGFGCTSEDFMAFCKEGRLAEAMGNLYKLDSSDSFIYSGLLQACVRLKKIREGIQVHTHIIKTGFQVNIFVQNHLVNMYAKCQLLEFALELFDKMPERNVVSWTAMITGYAQEERAHEAIGLFCEMHRTGVGANQFTFGSVLRACASLKSLQQAELAHAYIVKSGYGSDVIVGSALVDTYAKCQTVEYAGQVFDEMPERDAISWNAIIAGYAQNGYGQEALELFSLMQHTGIIADQVAITSVLKACSILAALEHGLQVHAHVFRCDFVSDVSVSNALTDMYSKSGNIMDAGKVFGNIWRHDVISWNTMITGCAQNEKGKEAINLFCKMLLSDVNPNHLTFAIILRACASETALREGHQIHALVIKSEFNSDISVNSALVGMYAKCGRIDDASQVFENMSEENIILWNEMISGYAQNGYGGETLELFSRLQLLGMRPNQFTFASVLGVCASLTALEEGKQVHAHIIKYTFELDVHVRSALIDIYGKCGNIEEAHKLFDDMLERDVVSWSGMIAAYVQHGYGEEALRVFCQMQRAGLKPDQFTFGSVLKACSTLAALEQSKCVHAHVIKSGLEMDVFVGSALVDMYAKCGIIEEACKVFKIMGKWDIVLCNAMITGFVQHGYTEEALQLFEQMQRAGSKPNYVTLVGVLSACRHAGLVNEGKYYFDSINRVYGIMATPEHYSCIVDLLGRAGYIVEAEKIINNMPFEPSPVVWRTLLSACRIHGNLELGKYAAERLLELEPQNDAAYVLLSNIYAAAGSWDDVARVRKMMRDSGVKKERGQSWIEVKDKVHSFFIADDSHPEMENIYPNRAAQEGRVCAQHKLSAT